jgi:carboxylesterase
MLFANWIDKAGQDGQPSKKKAEYVPTTGVLLIHGFNGSLRDMEEIEVGLRKHNLATRNMPLPGQRGPVREMLSAGWPEWVQAVGAEYLKMRQTCERVFLVGHSLGGALALHIAAHEEVAGLVIMCAPLNLYPWMGALIRAANYLVPPMPSLRKDMNDPQARQHDTHDVSRRTPMWPIESLVNYLPTLSEELFHITAPALIMVSTRDLLVPARDGREIYHRIGSSEKYLVTFHHSSHVIMKDHHDREEVFVKTEAFILRHAYNLRRHPF